MKHLRALGIKFVVLTVIMFSIFAIFNDVSLLQLLLISFIVAGVTFLVGDLFLLPRIGNVMTTIIDFGFTFLLFLGLASAVVDVAMPVVLASLAASFFYAISESIFHIYMNEHVFGIEREARFPLGFQTEFSDEIDPRSISKENQKEEDES